MANWFIYGCMVSIILLLILLIVLVRDIQEYIQDIALYVQEWRQEKIDLAMIKVRKDLEDTKKKIEEAEEATMPNSCRSIIKKCRHKGAISEQEEEKLLRNLRTKELIGVEWFRSLLSSFDYNRTDEWMIELCEEVKKRIQREKVKWSDDGDIIYGAIVEMYGNCGTSPRIGWIEEEEIILDLIQVLDEEIQSSRWALEAEE